LPPKFAKLSIPEAHWNPVTKEIQDEPASKEEIESLAAKARNKKKVRNPVGSSRKGSNTFKPSSPEQAKADKKSWNDYWEGSWKNKDVKEETKSGDESLRDWFSKSSGTDPKTGRKVKGWRQIGGPFAGAPCARQEGQTSTPKCGSSKMAANLSDDEEDKAFNRKNREDPNQPKKSGAAKPTNVATEETIIEKKDACYKKVKSRYKVWPSAYASGALVKCRKVGASNWGTKTEETMLDEEMTTAQKAKEKRLKAKYDKSGMKQNMIDQYGEKKGTEIYFAKIRKEAMVEEIDYVDAYEYIIEMLVAADYAEDYKAAEVMFEHISDEFTATILEEYIEEKARGTRKKTTVHAYDVDETLFGHGKKGKPSYAYAIIGISLVLFFLALEMILGVRIYKEAEPESASIVPIAFPLIAGAGTLTTLVSIRSEFATVNIIVGILINAVLVFLVLKNTKHLEHFLGKNGINVLRKVFGIILLAISVKLFTTNLPTLLS